MNTDLESLNLSQDVFTRMRLAYENGRGIRISAAELQNLSLTILGEIWCQPDPRDED